MEASEISIDQVHVAAETTLSSPPTPPPEPAATSARTPTKPNKPTAKRSFREKQQGASSTTETTPDTHGDKPTPQRLYCPPAKAIQILGAETTSHKTRDRLGISADPLNNKDVEKGIQKADVEFKRMQLEACSRALSEVLSHTGPSLDDNLNAMAQLGGIVQVNDRTRRFFGDDQLDSAHQMGLFHDQPPHTKLPRKAQQVLGDSRVAGRKAVKILGDSADDAKARMLADKAWNKEMKERANRQKNMIINTSTLTPEQTTLVDKTRPVSPKAMKLLGCDKLEETARNHVPEANLRCGSIKKMMALTGNTNLAPSKAQSVLGESFVTESLKQTKTATDRFRAEQHERRKREMEEVLAAKPKAYLRKVPNPNTLTRKAVQILGDDEEEFQRLDLQEVTVTKKVIQFLGEGVLAPPGARKRVGSMSTDFEAVQQANLAHDEWVNSMKTRILMSVLNQRASADQTTASNNDVRNANAKALEILGDEALTKQVQDYIPKDKMTSTAANKATKVFGDPRISASQKALKILGSGDRDSIAMKMANDQMAKDNDTRKQQELQTTLNAPVTLEQQQTIQTHPNRAPTKALDLMGDPTLEAKSRAQIAELPEKPARLLGYPSFKISAAIRKRIGSFTNSAQATYEADQALKRENNVKAREFTEQVLAQNATPEQRKIPDTASGRIPERALDLLGDDDLHRQALLAVPQHKPARAGSPK